MGQGYHCQYTPDQEAILEKARVETINPNPLSNAYPTFFHCLGATAENIAFNLEANAGEETSGYQEWYSTLKNEFTIKVMKVAATEVDKKWLTWKANQLDRLAESFKHEIGTKVRERGIQYFFETAKILELQVLQKGAPVVTAPTLITSKKHMASGSIPKVISLPASTPKAMRVNPPCAVKCPTSTLPAPQGWELTQNPHPTAYVDPSPTPHLKKTTPTPPMALGTDPDRIRILQTPPTKLLPLTTEKPDATTLTTMVLSKILE